MKEGQGGAREAKRRAAELVAHTDGHEGARRQRGRGGGQLGHGGSTADMRARAGEGVSECE